MTADADDDLLSPVESSPGSVFTAQYAGECSEGDDIEPGDQIRADGHDGYSHASCLRLASRPVIWE
jgi:hypothetical protein